MIKVLEHLEGYISGHLKIAKTVLSLIKCETKLAGQSIFPLLLNTCMILVVLMSVWSLIMILAGYYLIVLLGNFALSCSFILASNILIVFILMKYLNYNLKNMSFVNTRAFFSKKEHDDYEPTEENESRDKIVDRATKKSTTPITNT